MNLNTETEKSEHATAKSTGFSVRVIKNKNF